MPDANCFQRATDAQIAFLAAEIEAIKKQQDRVEEKIDDLIASYSLKYDVVISGLVYPAEAYQRFNTPSC